jgi:hypothetical protein
MKLDLKNFNENKLNRIELSNLRGGHTYIPPLGEPGDLGDPKAQDPTPPLPDPNPTHHIGDLGDEPTFDPGCGPRVITP